MRTGKTTKPAAAAPSLPFNAAEHLRSEAEIAAYIESMLEDGDPRAVPVALRTVAEAVGGMAALAEKTGLSRETLYRTLSARGNPRLDTLAALLQAFGLRLAVQPATRRPRTATRRSPATAAT
jgi:probable addiction module antidote protein